jgi:hypothetical protein
VVVWGGVRVDRGGWTPDFLFYLHSAFPQVAQTPLGVVTCEKDPVSLFPPKINRRTVDFTPTYCAKKSKFAMLGSNKFSSSPNPYVPTMS